MLKLVLSLLVLIMTTTAYSQGRVGNGPNETYLCPFLDTLNASPWLCSEIFKHYPSEHMEFCGNLSRIWRRCGMGSLTMQEIKLLSNNCHCPPL